RAPTARIGVWCARSRRGDGRSAELVAAWCEGVGAAGAVWTDLTANYAEHHPQGFSLDHAEAYLAGLRGESRDEAVRYIAQAPRATDTPLRRHLEAADWWRAELRRLALAPSERCTFHVSRIADPTCPLPPTSSWAPMRKRSVSITAFRPPTRKTRDVHSMFDSSSPQ
ncbi:MAG: hypothetical protein AAFV49_07755, partial [Pseudomonadota bacterium]